MKENRPKIYSDYDRRNKETRTKQNALNKSRSRSMEQRVARYLGGKRVPMSGAGSIKGDAIVYTDKGLLVIECKTSAALQRGESVIRIQRQWFEHLDRDVYSMSARFGAVIIHYHGFTGDYVLLDPKYREDYGIGDVPLVVGEIDNIRIVAGYALRRSMAIEYLRINSIIEIPLKFGSYYLTDMDTFKEILNGSA